MKSLCKVRQKHVKLDSVVYRAQMENCLVCATSNLDSHQKNELIK